jgi:Uncharacterised nucleotidyltransferase
MRTTIGHPGANNGEPIAEAQLLIACLRGSPLDLPGDTDWRALVTLAEVHGVLPLVHGALVENGAKIPEFFLNAVRDSQAFTEILAAELERLLASFAQHRIEVIPLKGPVLAETLYGDATARPCTDLDLLVRTSDFIRAEQLLMDAGWIASAPADEYHRSFVRDSILMELHFGVASPRAFPFDLNATWSGARNGAFRGQPLKLMSETDHALYLLLHGLKHGYGKLLWILDSARALETVGECSPREFVERARAQGLQQVLCISCAMVFEVLPKSLPEGLAAVLAESPEAMQAARATVEKLLAGEAGNGRGPEIWGFYLQAETEAGGRWRRRLTFFIPTNEDYRWIESHRIPRSFAPLLRPFRLLAKHGLRQAWRTAFPPSV